MAKRGIPRNPGYKSGDHYSNCYSCGFQFLASELKETWDHRWVCDEDFENRHPQDFLVTKPDIIAADQPLLPDTIRDDPGNDINGNKIERELSALLLNSLSESHSLGSTGVGTADIQISSTGDYAYVLDTTANLITQYDLPTINSLRDATTTGNTLDFSSETTAETGFCIDTTGTYLYLVSNLETVYQYTLTTPWDLSTASYASLTGDLSSEITVVSHLIFGDTNTKLYAADRTGNTIYQYSVTSSDASTISYSSKSLDTSSETGAQVRGISLDEEGDRLWVWDSGQNTLYKYTLTTAFDISTATYSGESLALSVLAGFGQGIDVVNGRLFIADVGTQAIKSYSNPQATSLIPRSTFNTSTL